MNIINKSIFLILALIFINTTSYSQNIVSLESKFEGRWLTHDGRAVIKIFKDGKSFSGVIDSILYADQRQSLVGITVLKGFSFERNKLVGGTMYDPESGEKYKCKLWLDENDRLKVRDFCGIFFKTFTWTRDR